MPGIRGEESVSCPGPRVTDGGWDLNSSPLYQQQVLRFAGSSLQSPKACFLSVTLQHFTFVLLRSYSALQKY